MKKHHLSKTALAILSLSLAAGTLPAHADERGDIEQVRATTMAILQALVDSGLLSREKADAIVRQAQQAKSSSGPSGAVAGGVSGAAAGAATSGVDAAGRNVIRVPYVSETTKAEMREQIKQEVLAQAKEERWGNPGAMPEWTRRITIDGDVRARYEMGMFDEGNLDAGGPLYPYLSQTGTDPVSASWSPDLSNTTHDRNRMTLRARLGVTARLGDEVITGIRLASGGDNSPVSTSQTQGNNFSKPSIWLDRAYIQWTPRADVTLNAGRFANPFYGTDLTWPDDLNFDGAAVNYSRPLDARNQIFAAVGAFPLQELSLSSSDKWLYAAQIGNRMTLDYGTSVDFGLAYYNFNNVEGQYDGADPPLSQYASATPYLTSEYPKSVRQKGNTLIRLNPRVDSSNAALSPIWGLASKYKPVDLSAGVTFNQFAPFAVRATFDYVKNTGFDMQDIRSRANPAQAGLDVAEKTTALQTKVVVGKPRIDHAGDWQGSVTWRRMERDAWMDAFTDTTWHLGGTNYEGWSLGGQYGIATRTSVGMRWTSTHNLKDGQVFTDASNGNPFLSLSSAPLKIDVFQLELNSRF